MQKIDITKLAVHRPKSFATGGTIKADPSWDPAIRGGPEARVPSAAVERLREATKGRTFRQEYESTIVEPIVRRALKSIILKVLWQTCDGRFPFMLAPPAQRLVVIESPFGHPTAEGMEANAEYGRKCMLDSIRRGEAPYASHLLYTQCLDDQDVAERKQGMEAGFAWGAAANHIAVYIDRGVSGGMLEGIKRHQANGKTIEFRSIA